jgi:hypothetical protein
MQELASTEFGCVRALFEGIDFMRAAVFTVLEGRQAGRVWVDRQETPASVLMRSDACYVAGEPSHAFLDELLAYLRAEVMPYTEHVLLYSFAGAWRDALDALLGAYAPRRVLRTVYRFDPDAFRARHGGWLARVPEGFAVAPVDAVTAPQVGGIPELWGSVDHFLAEGFGFCVTRDGARVSSAQTVFVGDRHAETGVGTEEPHRRQGHAVLAASAYLEHCLQVGITPEWGHYYNAASGNLALKMGFVEPREIEVTYVHVTEGHIVAERGGAMSTEVGWADPERVMSEPRVGRVAGFHYLYVDQKHVAESAVGWAMGDLMPKALGAYLQGQEGVEPPPMLAMFIDLPGEEQVYDVQVGYAFHGEATPRGGAQVRYVEPVLCAGIVVWGTLDDVLKSYGPLMSFVEARGLKNVEGWREWYLYWEGDQSRNNVTLVQHVVED